MQDLIKALGIYKAKWEQERDNTTDRDIIIQKTGMIYMAQWIINSINAPGTAVDIRNILKK